ncbi:MAG: hypothetical protein PHN78_05125 [Dehalococcoidales bacterium]|nr:hypothetical protein [Dehalococcoidales bacterium]
MDLYCKRCGEPWELDYVQHDMTILERVDFNTGKGCPSCKGKQICDKKEDCSECEHQQGDRFSCRLNMFKRPFRAEISAVLTDMLGDDVDGLAAEMEDAEYMLGSKFWE